MTPIHGARVPDANRQIEEETTEGTWFLLRSVCHPRVIYKIEDLFERYELGGLGGKLQQKQEENIFLLTTESLSNP